jgi:alpha-tubulin suppressor-like RCC1 family protein
MPIKLLIHQNVPGKDILQNSIKDEVDWEITNGLSGVPNDITRLGLMYDNHHAGIPFGTESLTIDGYQFIYFKKELFDLLQQNHITDVDLLACDMNDQRFVDEVQRIKQVLPDLTINYSLNKTGGAVGSDWVMESNGQSVKDLYFNQNIASYNHSLGSNAFHSALVMADGTVRTFGWNLFGQLGNGTTIDSCVPITVCGISNAIMVSCGGAWTAVLLNDGTVRTFGNGSNGELGNGTLVGSLVPVEVCLIVNGTAVACGSNHTAVLLDNGEVATFGASNVGELGNGTVFVISSVRVMVCGITSANAIACGERHTAVLLTDGTVKTFGENQYGQLGNNSTTNASLPVTVFGITNAIAVGCGKYHTVILLADGTVRTFGLNGNGQLGRNFPTTQLIPGQATGISGAIAVAGGSNHTVVLLNNGTVRTFGLNTSGQLGDGTITNTNSGPASVVNSITQAIAIACGFTHTGILLNDGTVRTFGSNGFGQLGNSTTSIFPTSIPTTVTLGLDKVFRIWDSLIGSIYCVHQDNLVRTKRGYIPIKEVVAGDTVYDEHNQEVTVKYNIKLMKPNREYVRIEKDALGINVPMNDLLMVRGHPVKHNDLEIECERFVGVNPKVTEVTLNSGSYVYCLCTDDRIYVDIENVPVCTRAHADWVEMTTNKRDIQWVGQ